MTGREPKSYANTDERQQGDISGDDENIRQQAGDVADERQQSLLPDPGGERHAQIEFDDEDIGDEADEIQTQ